MPEDYTKIVRKTLEDNLKTVVAASAVPALAIRYPSTLNFEPEDHEEYLRITNHPAMPKVWTMGPNGRISGSGFAKIMVFTRPKYGQDRNDTLAGIVCGGFPYNLDLEREGIRTIIREEPHHREFTPDVAGWGSSAVDVYWEVMRIR